MKMLLTRLRPSVLLIALMLTCIAIADIALNGDVKVGLAAVGALAAITRDVVNDG